MSQDKIHELRRVEGGFYGFHVVVHGMTIDFGMLELPGLRGLTKS